MAAALSRSLHGFDSWLVRAPGDPGLFAADASSARPGISMSSAKVTVLADSIRPRSVPPPIVPRGLARPAPEGSRQVSLIRVAELFCDLGEREVPAAEHPVAGLESSAIQDLAPARALLGESALQRARAHLRQLCRQLERSRAERQQGRNDLLELAGQRIRGDDRLSGPVFARFGRGRRP